MAYEQKDMSGAMFSNRKQNDRQPDMRGDVKINGKVWSIAGWWKSGRDGGEFLSLAVSEPRPRTQDAPSDRTPAPVSVPTMPARRQQAAQSQPPYDEQPQFKESDLPF